MIETSSVSWQCVRCGRVFGPPETAYYPGPGEGPLCPICTTPTVNYACTGCSAKQSELTRLRAELESVELDLAYSENARRDAEKALDELGRGDSLALKWLQIERDKRRTFEKGFVEWRKRCRAKEDALEKAEADLTTALRERDEARAERDANKAENIVIDGAVAKGDYDTAVRMIVRVQENDAIRAENASLREQMRESEKRIKQLESELVVALHAANARATRNH